jgi:hypothetical protein
MKMEVAGFPQAPIYLCQTKRHHNPEDGILQLTEFFFIYALNNLDSSNLHAWIS